MFVFYFSNFLLTTIVYILIIHFFQILSLPDSEKLMAYAAVTSLMETLYLHFLQSQPSLPIEDLEAQIRIGNENVGLLHQIVEAQMREMELDEEASPKFFIKVNYYPEMKKLIKKSSSQNERMIHAWDSKLLTSRLREVGEVKQKIVSLHRNLGLLQQSLEKSEMRDVRVMKDLEAQIRDASFKLEEGIEMELRTIYVAKGSLHITPCLLRRHGIFNEAEEQTDYQITENLGLLEKIVEAQIKEMELNEEASSSKCLRIRKNACLPRLYGNHQLARLREVGKVKREMVLLLQRLGSLQESEIGNDDAGTMKDLETEIREWINNAQQIGNEMELTTFYLAKDSLLHITDCLLKLHEIFIEAQKQTDYHRNELIRIQSEYQPQLAKAASSQNQQRLTDVSLLVVENQVSHLKLLRVVDMRYGIWNGVKNLNVFANLVHLRYLALCTYMSSEIKLFEHWNMQSLIVRGDSAILYPSKPSRIWKMPLLRNFCIGRICSLEAPSTVYRNLKNISWLDLKSCTKDLFTMIPNLKTLGVDGDHYGNSIDWFYNFVHLEQLEKLSIRRWMKFDLDMCNIPWATSLPNLKKLTFLESNLRWHELSAISRLPNLEALKLIDACRGPKWETSDGGFHQLKRLVIKKTGLQYWNAVGDHFPMLKCLEISECSNLKEIPRGFADITTLALIQLSKCMDSLVVSAKWIQEEQKYNYGNDALLVRAENIYKVSFYPFDISLTI
nr:putative late blight resistance protein homolog R1A-10 isoform X1 [Ipomoea batatas]GMD27116.1 putative late blight resistance protein homolog R1A-10 isoform X1 [Ipomoea batatas]